MANPNVIDYTCEYSRTKTPWHLTDGHGISTEQKMYGQHVATDRKGFSEFHQWPSVVHRWKLTIFEVIILYAAHLKAGKNEENFTCNLAGSFAITYSQKSNYAIKSAKLHHFWRYGCQIGFKRSSRSNVIKNIPAVKPFWKDWYLEKVSLREWCQPKISSR